MFVLLAVVYMLKGLWLLYGDQLMDVQLLGTRMQIIAAIMAACAVGCGIIEAIGRRAVGQASVTSKASENETLGN